MATATIDPTFVRLVSERSGQVIAGCYACQKCTVGCPTAPSMDYAPDKVLKLVQFGWKEAVLRSSSIWLCAACDVCGKRCPNNINIAAVMDALKQLAVEGGYTGRERRIPAFHRSFLGSIQGWGRIHEVTMLVLYKLRSRDLLADLDLGVKLVLKGKMPLLPRRIKGLGAVRGLFHKVARRF